MSFDRSLDAYRDAMAARGVSPYTASPPLWRLLWAGGIALPPPPFLGFATLMLLSGTIYGLGMTLAFWMLGFDGPEKTFADAAGWGLIAGLVFGLAMAAYYRHLARQHRLGTWAQFRDHAALAPATR